MEPSDPENFREDRKNEVQGAHLPCHQARWSRVMEKTILTASEAMASRRVRFLLEQEGKCTFTEDFRSWEKVEEDRAGTVEFWVGIRVWE